MGVKKLKQIIENLCLNNGLSIYKDLGEFVATYKKEKFNSLIQDNTSEYRKKIILNTINKSFITVAIDVSLYGHKYKRNFDSIEFGFLKQILSCLSSQIIPLYVFDGKPPSEKNDTIKKRINYQKNNKYQLNSILNYTNDTINEYCNFLTDLKPLIQLFKDLTPLNEVELLYNTYVSGSTVVDTDRKTTTTVSNLIKKSLHFDSNDAMHLQSFFEKLGIPYIIASGEADSMISKLSQLNYIDACLSEDSDMLPRGCKNVIQIKDNKIYRYNLNGILNQLNLSYESFIDYCILLGCDYCKSVKNVDPYDLLAYVKSDTTINEILENKLGYNKYIVNYCLSLRKIFSNSNENVNQKYCKIKLATLNSKTIFDYLTIKNIKLDQNATGKIINKIYIINKMLKEI